jgi:hypothetical protein
VAASETVAGWGALLAVGSVTAAVIVNAAVGNYQDSKGTAYGSASNTASVSTAPVAVAQIMPKNVSLNPVADAATIGTVATTTFTITNDSNINTAYVISAVSVSAGRVVSVAFAVAGAQSAASASAGRVVSASLKPSGAPVAAFVGTVSPTVPIGASVNVLVATSTAGTAIASHIDVHLTVTTTAPSSNGPQTDTGEAWIYVARGPKISGIAPANGATPAPEATA